METGEPAEVDLARFAAGPEMLLAFDDLPPEPESVQLSASYDSAGRLVELRERGGARGEKVLYRAAGTARGAAHASC